MRLAVIATIAAMVPAIAACSSGSTGSTPTTPSSSASGSYTYVYASSSGHGRHWWHTNQDGSGSHSTYCGMLRATVHAGDSVLSTLAQQQASQVRAFTTEMTASAPARVAGSWHTLGTALVALVAASQGSGAAATSVDPQKVERAVSAVAADAKSRCGLNLAS